MVLPTKVAVGSSTKYHSLVTGQVVVNFYIIQVIIKHILAPRVCEKVIVLVLQKLFVGKLTPPFCQLTGVGEFLDERPEKLINSQSYLFYGPSLLEDMKP